MYYVQFINVQNERMKIFRMFFFIVHFEERFPFVLFFVNRIPYEDFYDGAMNYLADLCLNNFKR